VILDHEPFWKKALREYATEWGMGKESSHAVVAALLDQATRGKAPTP
jgi:hypothetical protein